MENNQNDKNNLTNQVGNLFKNAYNKVSEKGQKVVETVQDPNFQENLKNKTSQAIETTTAETYNNVKNSPMTQQIGQTINSGRQIVVDKYQQIKEDERTKQAQQKIQQNYQNAKQFVGQKIENVKQNETVINIQNKTGELYQQGKQSIQNNETIQTAYTNTKNSVNQFVNSSKNILNGTEDNNDIDNLHKKNECNNENERMDFYENDNKDKDDDDLFKTSDKKNQFQLIIQQQNEQKVACLTRFTKIEKQ